MIDLKNCIKEIREYLYIGFFLFCLVRCIAVPCIMSNVSTKIDFLYFRNIFSYQEQQKFNDYLSKGQVHPIYLNTLNPFAWDPTYFYDKKRQIVYLRVVEKCDQYNEKLENPDLYIIN